MERKLSERNLGICGVAICGGNLWTRINLWTRTKFAARNSRAKFASVQVSAKFAISCVSKFMVVEFMPVQIWALGPGAVLRVVVAALMLHEFPSQCFRASAGAAYATNEVVCEVAAHALAQP